MSRLGFTSFFNYTKSQKYGLLVLLVICASLQIFIFYGDFNKINPETKAEKEWIALQKELDLLKTLTPKADYAIRPFNPNFITDYKGYQLGMSTVEIDRLLHFRKQNKYVNSAAEFQSVTLVSDSLLQTMASHFKFPDWIKDKRTVSNYVDFKKNRVEKIIISKDINLATADDLIAISGIGEKLSQRILDYKETVGGFVAMEQLTEVWGLSSEVIRELNRNFKISNNPAIVKLAINDASLKELSQFNYFNHGVAKQIVIYRSMNGNFNNIDDLLKIKGFPVEKAKIIDLYLKF